MQDKDRAPLVGSAAEQTTAVSKSRSSVTVTTTVATTRMRTMTCAAPGLVTQGSGPVTRDCKYMYKPAVWKRWVGRIIAGSFFDIEFMRCFVDQWRIQDFPNEGTNPWVCGKSLLYGTIFADSCMEIKEIGTGGNCLS